MVSAALLFSVIPPGASALLRLLKPVPATCDPAAPRVVSQRGTLSLTRNRCVQTRRLRTAGRQRVARGVVQVVSRLLHQHPRHSHHMCVAHQPRQHAHASGERPGALVEALA